VSASINQTVTGVVVNGAWLRLKGSGTPTANEAVINSATGLITFGQYVDAGDYVDVIYSPIGSSSGSGGGGNYHLPYNGNSGYYLGGDSILHLLPAGGASVAAGDTTTLNVHTNGYNDLRYHPLENQRLSTTNTPTFAGLTSNGVIKLIGQSGTPSAPSAGTQNMYADSTGAWTLQGSNGFALALSKNRLTANHRVFVQNKDYTLADSADIAYRANGIAVHFSGFGAGRGIN
jgi:hypothetical protein